MDDRLENRKKRLMLGLTMQELGDRVGVTRQTICNYEQGKVPMSEVLKRVISEELAKSFIETPTSEIYKNASSQIISSILFEDSKIENTEELQ